MVPKNAPLPVAYSYIRFSSPEQAKGDSLRRQTEATAEWCKRNKIVLDTSTTFHDLGRSAYTGTHRTNPDRNALAAFLKLVEEGRVPRGSYLVIENLDRLSREDLDEGVQLLLGLTSAGIRIVQLKPSETIFQKPVNFTQLILAAVELSRGHSESLMKSDRIGAAWERRRKAVREKGAIMTLRLPAWVQEKDGKLLADPVRAKVVRRIFNLAINGHGLGLIVKTLTTEKVPTWGRGGAWSKSYVKKILTGRSVLGEYQPIKAGKKDGTPLLSYYPAVIDPTLWDRAQAAMASRKDNPGRLGTKVASLFTGLLMDARTRTKMLIAGQTQGPKERRRRVRVITSAGAMEGREVSITLPYPVFEAAVLSKLQELKPSDIIGEEQEGESVAMASELTSVEQKLDAIQAELTGDGGDIPVLARAAKVLEEKRQDLTRRLALARQKEANPRSMAWAETRTLLDIAEDETDRVRLRGLLRTIIDEIWILVVPRRAERLALIQMNFVGGARRTYLLYYKRPPGKGQDRSGRLFVQSWSQSPDDGIGVTGDIDLSVSKDAKKLDKGLSGLPQSELDDYAAAAKPFPAKPKKSVK